MPVKTGSGLRVTACRLVSVVVGEIMPVMSDSQQLQKLTAYVVQHNLNPNDFRLRALIRAGRPYWENRQKVAEATRIKLKKKADKRWYNYMVDHVSSGGR